MLKLEQGFDDAQISFGRLDDRILIKVACILIGGFLLVRSVSPILTEGYYLFRGRFEGRGEYYLPLIGSLINVGIGYLLITKYDQVTNFLLTKKDKGSAN